jgi:hypothetical protein
LRLVQCRNVRNRDLFSLAHSSIQLQALTIGDDTNKPWVTNKGLASVGRMTSLRSLALHDCNSITNNGLASLTGLTQLASLSLRGCRKITNHGLETLQVGRQGAARSVAGGGGARQGAARGLEGWAGVRPAGGRAGGRASGWGRRAAWWALAQCFTGG